MKTLRRATLIATTLVVATVGAGCGAADKFRYPYAQESAETIVLDAMVATTEADSLRLSGSMDLQRTPAFRFNVMSDAEDRCSGEISISTSDFDVVITPEGDFLKGSATSWDQLPDGPKVAGRLLADRWVELDRGGRLRFGMLCGLARDLLSPEQSKAVEAGRVPDGVQLTHEGLSEAAGEKAVRVDFADDRGVTDIWVSLKKPHHVVKLTQKNARGTAKVVLSDFGFPVTVTVPKGKDVVGLSGRSG